MAVPAGAVRPATSARSRKKTEPADDGLLRALGRRSMSGLQYVGETLSKPSRALWGTANAALGGESGGGVLNLVPFSDAMGLTDPASGVQASQFLENRGVLPENVEGFDRWDIPRFGADVIGDPLTYVGGVGTLKSLGKGGSVLAKVSPSINKLSRVERMTKTVGDLVGTIPPAALETVATRSGYASAADFVSRAGSERVGGLLGVGLPFKSPSFTIGNETLARHLDRLGSTVSGLGPVRALRGVFDPSVLGKFGRGEQRIAPHIYDAQRAARAPANKTVLQVGREWEDLANTFDNEMGEHVRKTFTASDIDPREMEAAVGEVMAKRMAEWSDPVAVGERQFRSQYKHLIQKSRKDVDANTIHPRFDEITDEYRNLTGLYDATPEDALAALQRADPRPVRTAQDVIAEAEGVVRGGGLRTVTPEAEQLLKDAEKGVPAFVTINMRRILKDNGLSDNVIDASTPEELLGMLREKRGGGIVDLPFKQGEVVIAGDRGNYGYVQNVGPRTSNVLFKNPETGNIAVKNIPNDQLTKAFEAGSDEAVQFSKVATRKVFEDTMRMIAETGDPDESFRAFMGDTAAPQSLKDRMTEVAETARAANDEVYAAVQALGGKTSWHGIEQGHKTQHFPRYVSQKIAKDVQQRNPSRAFQVSFASMKARTPEIRDLRAATVNELVTNNRYRGDNVAKKILDDFGDELDEGFGQQRDEFDFGKLDPELGRQAHAEALATWIKDHPKAELYANAAIDDFADYQRGAHRVVASLKAGHQFLAKEVAENPGDNLLVDVFRRAGLDEEAASEYFQQTFGIDPRSAGVTEETARAFSGLFTLFNDKLDGPIAQTIDRFNRAFKSSVTVLFPSFMARNATSGQFVNLSSGYIQSVADVARYGRAVSRTRDLLKKARAGTAEGDDLALLDELQSAQVFDKSRGFNDVEYATAPGSGWLPDDPRHLRQTARGAREAVGLDQIGIDRVPGVMGARRAFHTAVGTGSAVNQHVEFFNRVPMYVYLRDSGYAPDVAAEAVERLHFDYSDLTPTERDYFRRIAPFYTFQRKMSGLLADQLLERPGGLVGQTIRASTQLDSEQPMPESITKGLAVPIGQLPDGTQRLLTGFGFAHEAPLEFIGAKNGMPDPTVTLAEVGSALNPLLKAGIEGATGRSLFQRRDLDELEPNIGRTLTNIGLRDTLPSGRARPFISPGFENLAANSPAARFLTTARTLTDPRKYQSSGGILDALPGQAVAMNLLTGAKLTDVSPRVQRGILIDQLSDLMKSEGAQAMETIRFRRAEIEAAEKRDPLLADRMRMLNSEANKQLAQAKASARKPKPPARR